jgi:hypothetical protein
MERVSFVQLPLIVKIAVGVAFFDAWMSLEEFVINREGLWRFMPFYRTDTACAWDLAVALIIVAGLWRLSMRRG